MTDQFDQWCRDNGEHITDDDGAVVEVAQARCEIDGCDAPASHRSGWGNTRQANCCVPHTNERENEGAWSRSLDAPRTTEEWAASSGRADAPAAPMGGPTSRRSCK